MVPIPILFLSVQDYCYGIYNACNAQGNFILTSLLGLPKGDFFFIVRHFMHSNKLIIIGINNSIHIFFFLHRNLHFLFVTGILLA